MMEPSEHKEKTAIEENFSDLRVSHISEEDNDDMTQKMS